MFAAIFARQEEAKRLKAIEEDDCYHQIFNYSSPPVVTTVLDPGPGPSLGRSPELQIFYDAFNSDSFIVDVPSPQQHVQQSKQQQQNKPPVGSRSPELLDLFDLTDSFPEEENMSDDDMVFPLSPIPKVGPRSPELPFFVDEEMAEFLLTPETKAKAPNEVNVVDVNKSEPTKNPGPSTSAKTIFGPLTSIDPSREPSTDKGSSRSNLKSLFKAASSKVTTTISTSTNVVGTSKPSTSKVQQPGASTSKNPIETILSKTKFGPLTSLDPSRDSTDKDLSISDLKFLLTKATSSKMPTATSTSANTSKQVVSGANLAAPKAPQLPGPQPIVNQAINAISGSKSTTLNIPTYRRNQIANAGLPPSKLRLRELQRKLTRPNESHYVPVEEYVPSSMTNLDQEMLDAMPEDIQREIKGYIRYKTNAQAPVAAVAPKPSKSKATTSKATKRGPSKVSKAGTSKAPKPGPSSSKPTTKSTLYPVFANVKQPVVVVDQPKIDTVIMKTKEKMAKRDARLEAKKPFIKYWDLYRGLKDHEIGQPHLCGKTNSVAVSKILKQWFLTEPILSGHDINYALKYFTKLIDGNKHDLLLKLLQGCKQWLLQREMNGVLEIASWKTLFFETFAGFFDGELEFRSKIPDDLFYYARVEDDHEHQEELRGTKRDSTPPYSRVKKPRIRSDSVSPEI